MGRQVAQLFENSGKRKEIDWDSDVPYA
jgi:hypothetical protein